MLVRIVLVAAVLGAVGLAVWHPAPRAIAPVAVPSDLPSAPIGSDPSPGRRHRFLREASAGDALVVYVVGAVRHAGLYRLREGDRFDRAIALAGGFTAAADPAGVNLAQRAADGEEIDVPKLGEASHLRGTAHGSSRRRRATPPPEGSVDVNAAGADALGAVPGIGRAIGARIVELREREGSFASLDELLDVAGMTQSRLERARPYLRDP